MSLELVAYSIPGSGLSKMTGSFTFKRLRALPSPVYLSVETAERQRGRERGRDVYIYIYIHAYVYIYTYPYMFINECTEVYIEGEPRKQDLRTNPHDPCSETLRELPFPWFTAAAVLPRAALALGEAAQRVRQ